MHRLMSVLETGAGQESGGGPIIAGISPHDDYLYAGRIYFPLFRAIRAKEAVIFGVTHGTVRRQIGDPRDVVILDAFDQWHGLSGSIEISPLRSYITQHLDARTFTINNEAQALEHSIEALVPFLQYFNPDIKITPIMVTAMPFDTMEFVSDRLAGVIASYIQERRLKLGSDIVFLISSDANHYGADFSNTPFGIDTSAHRRGTMRDMTIAETCLQGGLDGKHIQNLTNQLWGRTYLDQADVVWCGKYSIPFGLLTIRKVVSQLGMPQLEGKVLRYSDTYTEGVLPLTGTGMGLTAPFSLKHWVGFCSVAYRFPMR